MCLCSIILSPNPVLRLISLPSPLPPSLSLLPSLSPSFLLSFPSPLLLSPLPAKYCFPR